MRLKKIVHFLLAVFLVPRCAPCQSKIPDTTEDRYYIGTNPVAPFTGIRSKFTSLYLPALSNLETGLSFFGGKLWNKHFNVETRFSFGSPRKSFNLLQVQSGFNYCFTGKQYHQFYIGLFGNLFALHNLDTKVDQMSITGYVCTGRRFFVHRYFIDVRISQNLAAVSWKSLPGAQPELGFHPSPYKWVSPYIPYAAVNLGYMLK